jgi:GT2 family glycosyltransferase
MVQPALIAMKSVAVAILNWNGKNWLEKFLPNVIAHSEEVADIVIIDNGSTDDSFDFCSKNFPSVQWIGLEKNHGFAGGYNEGLQHLTHPYFMLLNSDVEVTPNWLLPLIDWMEERPALAACQPKVIDYQTKIQFEYAGGAGGYLDKDGYAFCAGRMFYAFEKDNGQYQGRKDVFWATGAAMMIRRSAWIEVNGFDADFFAHMEEIDLCWRLKNRGYSIGAELNSTVYHVGGGTLDRQNPMKTYLNFRNNLYLITKNHRRSALFFHIFRRLILDGVAGIRFATETKWPHLWAVVRAHFSFYVMLPNMLKKRKLESPHIKEINNSGLYKSSVVYAFFIQHKSKFSQLDPRSFVQ